LATTGTQSEEPLPILSTFQQFKEDLSLIFYKIHTAYIDSFNQSVSNRVTQSIPVDKFNTNIIQVSKEYKDEIAGKLYYIYEVDTFNECYDIFTKSVQVYLERMSETIDRLCGNTALASMVDSFENVKYSSLEISQIAYPMFPPGRSHRQNTCRSIIYIMFRERIYNANKVKEAMGKLDLRRSDDNILHKKI
jgi:hypothetical protein